MAIQTRVHPKTNKQQWHYTIWYKDIFGKNKRKNGAWRYFRKEAVHDETAFKAKMFNDNNFNTKLNIFRHNYATILHNLGISDRETQYLRATVAFKPPIHGIYTYILLN